MGDIPLPLCDEKPEFIELPDQINEEA